ncbi:minor tail protein [Mycobacterium phage Gandalf20]|nr:minor tail protein [Mycobacterium phage Gandalf20]
MTVTITADVRDVTGQPDNQQWVFSTVLRQQDGSILTQKQVRVNPVDGALSVELEPGFAIVVYGEYRWFIEVPEEDSPLWPLIASSVAFPPDSTADLIADTINGYLDLHPPAADWDGLIDVPSEFPPEAHTHTSEDITDLDAAIADYLADNPPEASSVAWDDVTGKPTTFTPSTHTHSIANVTGLQTALDEKLDEDAVDARVAVGTAALVDSAPDTLNTLNELAAALGDDPNFATTVASQIGAKADKTTTITAGTGLTGGGDLTADRTLSVSFGTSSTTACVGNDSRLSNTRTPTDGSVTNAKVASGAGIALSKLATGYVAGSDNSGARTLTIWVGTEAQYTAIGTKDSNTIYLRTA